MGLGRNILGIELPMASIIPPPRTHDHNLYDTEMMKFDGKLCYHMATHFQIAKSQL